MYKIQYQYSNRLPLCYFDDYDLGKEALGILQKAHPDARNIELVRILPISCISEFIDVTGGIINDYK